MVWFRSKITQAVLSYFFLNKKQEAYVNQLAARFGLDSGNAARKLAELEKEGVLKSRWQGNQRYYSLNHNFPLLKEYQNIIAKTVGIEQQLKTALTRLKGVEKAFLFGSYVAGQMDQFSDVDLLVVGDVDLLRIQKNLKSVEKNTGREINPVIVSKAEFRSRKNPFLKSLERKKKILLIE